MKKKWWHEKVAYQIYPKSFLDTKGNGIGDLRGVINKLDYLKELGVDIIWLSPCYPSPLADQGYDIADYYDIDPRFGTMADMDELLVEAKKRNMYILMDLVINHCSDEHEWFKKAMTDLDSEYAKYFFIEDGVNGNPPNNWRSYFGGSAWEKIEGTDKYYLHLFHKKQPDLNWENPKLRDEIYKMINWWLDKGLAGFRVDAIMNISKALPFTSYNYPPDREDGTVICAKMLEDAKNVDNYLHELRLHTFDKHDAFTVGEVFTDRTEDIPIFIGDDGHFSTMFDFNEVGFGKSDKGWYAAKPITPDDYRNCCFETQARVNDLGYISTIIENHDLPRGASYFLQTCDINDDSKKLLGTMQLMMKGLPFIYQGQEIGMENCDFTGMEEIDDISSIGEYQNALDAGLSKEDAFNAVKKFSRDNARTPMQWDDSDNAGFTTGTPWLMVNPKYKKINVKSQIDDENSVLNYYRKLTALRKNEAYKDTIVYGEVIPYLENEHNLMAFYREGEKQTLLVLGNFEKEEKTVKLEKKCKTNILSNMKNVEFVNDNEIKLSPYQCVILEVE
jgi:hypothetical protein